MSKLEFSRPLAVDEIIGAGTTVTIEADAAERERLAGRFSIPAIESLTADIRVTARTLGLVYVVEGSLKADVVQSCVVSLEPVRSTVEQEFSGTFHRATAALAEGDVMVVDPTDESDDPEPLEHGVIDLGELVAQHLSLALDPYPRKPDISLEQILPSQEDGMPTPFAALQRLKGGNDA